MTNATKVLQIARGELGYNRWSDPNTGTKYGRWMAKATGQAWYGNNGIAYCNMFVSWVLAQAGVKQPAPGHFAYVPYSINAYANAGRRVTNKRNAQPGDLVCFDWDGDGVADHIGFCEVNNGGYLTCLEGNTSGSWQGSQSNGGGVYRRTRYWDSVIEVLRPAYKSATVTTSKPAKLTVDKIWGRQTTAALQYVLGRPQDSVVSSQYVGNKKYVPAAGSGWQWVQNAVGSLIIAKLQATVGEKNADGIIGPSTVKSLQRFLGGVTVDGYAGANTVGALQRWINKKLGY